MIRELERTRESIQVPCSFSGRLTRDPLPPVPFLIVLCTPIYVYRQLLLQDTGNERKPTDVRKHVQIHALESRMDYVPVLAMSPHTHCR